MNQLQIGLRENKTNYDPGDDLHGAASWKLDSAADAVEIRLLWFTAGKGTRDAAVVNTARFDHPLAEAIQPFSFRLPSEPYSFSGKLITLTWAIELVVQPAANAALAEFVMAPGGREIQLSLPSG